MNKIKHVSCFLLMIFSINTLQATKLVKIQAIDKDYLLVYFIDGQINFVDDGKGSTAFTSDHDKANNTVQRFGKELDTMNVRLAENWIIKSIDDPNFSGTGLNPTACYRKSKLNGMAQTDWNMTTNDYNYLYTMEHSIYLKLPQSLEQGKTYTIEINSNTNTDVLSQTLEFDIFKNKSEAMHVNLVGFLDDNSIKTADLFLWLGDGGARDYASFVGNKVYVLNTSTDARTEIGTVEFWKSKAKEAGGYDLTASNVWKADFTSLITPGSYRIAIEGIGCSEDFEIRKNIYYEPYKVSTQGFFYMRIGQDSVNMRPVPRRPLYIPGISPTNTTVYITTMNPYHPEWKTFSSGDVWDKPLDWAKYVKPGKPKNANAYGGHSDALDWDRHLGHISVIYDMLLPYILTDGRLSDDTLGIAESGNGIPDILDEARNEVDFWLRLRDGKGYSHGITNPTTANILYQAENTTMAAWANAANCAMLANCFQIGGFWDLMNIYTDSAKIAYEYALQADDQMLDTKHDVGNGSIRGKDLKMMSAAFLYSLTGNKDYEDMVNSLSNATTNSSTILNNDMNQLWGTAAYLKTKQTINYPDLYNRMKASIIKEAKSKEANYINTRPSRRATDNDQGYFKTEQNVHRTLVAHAMSDTGADKDLFANALVLEADWGLGRNSANIIYMTTATTKLSTKKSIENCYTSGRDDGSVGLHPGHTPYINTDDWAPSMVMGKPSWMTSKCYPDYANWPRAEGYFNTRYVWAHAEFTPQQTMRGKMALYGYLYGLYKDPFVVSIPQLPVESAHKAFSIHPNPATEFVNIVMTDDLRNASISIIDSCGKRVLIKPIETKEFQVPTSNLNPGVYFLQVTSGSQSYVSKLMIK